MKRKCL